MYGWKDDNEGKLHLHFRLKVQPKSEFGTQAAQKTRVLQAFNAQKFHLTEPASERENYNRATQSLTKHLNSLKVSQVSFTKLPQTESTVGQPIAVPNLRVRLDWLNVSDKFADDTDHLNTIAAKICGVVFWQMGEVAGAKLCSNGLAKVSMKGLLGSDFSDLTGRKYFSDYTEHQPSQARFNSRFTTFELTFDAEKVNSNQYKENEGEDLDIDERLLFGVDFIDQ